MYGALKLFRIVRANVCLNFAIPNLFWFLWEDHIAFLGFRIAGMGRRIANIDNCWAQVFRLGLLQLTNLNPSKPIY